MNESKFAWTALVHIGTRMWHDQPEDVTGPLKCDETIYRKIIDHAKEVGVNRVVLDIGEALAYPSHPELAVEGSWSPDKLRAEVERLRKMGLEPIPKLNFSTAHDTWLGEYARMVSTPEYYKVCADVIRDVTDVFGKELAFLHIGYDEEAVPEQGPGRYEYACARQGELWWHDLLWFLDQVRSHGVRPWMWGDPFWHHPDEFPRRVTRDVLLSNWYYGRTFKEAGPFERGYEKVRLLAYGALDKLGYEQIPCATNWLPDYYDTPTNEVNFPMTVDYCRRVVSPELLKGFMMAPWCCCRNQKDLAFFNAGLDQVAKVIRGGK